MKSSRNGGFFLFISVVIKKNLYLTFTTTLLYAMKTKTLALLMLLASIKLLVAQTVTDVVTGLANRPYGLGSSGTTLFIGMESGEIYTIDSTIDAPTPQLLYNAPNSVYGLVLYGNNLYFSQYMSNSIYKIDITDANPVMTEVLTITGEPFDFVLADNYLYFTDMTEGNIYKFDITATSPVAELVISGLWYPAGIAKYGNHIYYAETFSAAVSQFDFTATNPSPTYVANIPYGFGIEFIGSELYVTLNQLDAIAMIDVAQPGASPVNYITTGIDWPIAVTANNGYLYISESTGYLVSKVAIALNNDQFIKTNIAVYPNPANTTFSVNTQANQVYIYQSNGSIAATYKGDFAINHKFDISTLKPGFYIISVTNTNGTENVKLIKY